MTGWLTLLYRRNRVVNSVLITGASTGLGLETALYLAEHGFKVYATMLDLSRRAALDEEAARRGVQVQVLKLDIRDKDDVDAAVREVVERSGGIHALVNNAGIGVRGYFEDLSEKEIRSVFETNVFGTVGGRIGSLAVSAYCATKFAQEGFGESLAQEVAPFGIYVSLVEPAIIRTERWGANRGVAKRALDPKSPYCAWFHESERLVDRLVKTSPTKPVDVACAVHSALAARRPRLRYMVGRRASLVMILRRYLPGELFERLYFGEVVRRVTKTR
jgi:NAD(P)-dependent dehydrogenase (short-subunit alcohol dehydrogenase family)